MSPGTSVTLACFLAIVVSCSGEDSGKDDPIDVDHLPEGDATGTAASGSFDYDEVIVSSTCPATAAGVALPAVTGTWSTVVRVIQLEGDLGFEFEDASGRRAFEMDGGIFGDRTFRIGHTDFFDDSISVTFIRLMDGEFSEGMDAFEGSMIVRVVATDGTDCRLGVDLSGTRR
jgi:hypothetical protein